MGATMIVSAVQHAIVALTAVFGLYALLLPWLEVFTSYSVTEYSGTETLMLFSLGFQVVVGTSLLVGAVAWAFMGVF
jgi:hypothetical protein